MNDRLMAAFPGLRTAPFHVTSARDATYNCIAWAGGDTTQWWWPQADIDKCFWPQAAPREVTMESFRLALGHLGYIEESNETLVPGFEKIAVFADDDGVPTHAARQLSSGAWTSKLGQAEDIQHPLRSLEGEIYGKVAIILKRRVSATE